MQRNAGEARLGNGTKGNTNANANARPNTTTHHSTASFSTKICYRLAGPLTKFLFSDHAQSKGTLQGNRPLEDPGRKHLGREISRANTTAQALRENQKGVVLKGDVDILLSFQGGEPKRSEAFKVARRGAPQFLRPLLLQPLLFR